MHARMVTSLLSRAQGDIEFLLGSGGARIERSTFGDMLAQAELYAFDHDGQPIPRRTGECVPIKHQKSEPGYDLDFAAQARLGRANRYLDAVGRVSRVLRIALQLYHGDIGYHWGSPPTDNMRGGVGDRIVCLYPLTPMGEKWIGGMRAKYPLSGELRPDELLALELVRQKKSPTTQRQIRLTRCDAQARKLLDAANEALLDAATLEYASARAIRMTSLRSIPSSELQ